MNCRITFKDGCSTFLPIVGCTCVRSSDTQYLRLILKDEKFSIRYFTLCDIRHFEVYV